MKRSSLRRTPMTRRYHDTGPDLETVMAVLQRDHFRCVRCSAPAQGERGVVWSLQHRKKRSAGVDNRRCNLVTLCGSGTTGCHGWAEAHSTLAADEGGWSVSRYADPATKPVLVDRLGRWVYLGDDGKYYDNPPCPERWGDEIGCDDDQPWHHCTGREPCGRKHECRCGSYVLVDPGEVPV